jgi:hypothetical protein
MRFSINLKILKWMRCLVSHCNLYPISISWYSPIKLPHPSHSCVVLHGWPAGPPVRSPGCSRCLITMDVVKKMFSFEKSALNFKAAMYKKDFTFQARPECMWLMILTDSATWHTCWAGSRPRPTAWQWGWIWLRTASAMPDPGEFPGGKASFLYCLVGIK